MSDANGRRYEVREERHAGVGLKELRVVGKERGMKNFEDAGRVDFGVFGCGVVALNRDGGDGEREEKQESLARKLRRIQTLTLHARTDWLIELEWLTVFACAESGGSIQLYGPDVGGVGVRGEGAFPNGRRRDIILARRRGLSWRVWNEQLLR